MNIPKKTPTAPRSTARYRGIPQGIAGSAICDTRGERGQAMIEFAFVMPLLILLLMGIFDLGRGVYAYNVVASAAREGARYGIFKPGDSTGIQNQAVANTFALDPNLISVTSNCKIPSGAYTTWCYKTNLLEVVVQYQFQPLTLFFSPLTLRGKSEMMIEVPPPD